MVFGRLRSRDTDIRVRHPGYDDSCNTLMVLYGVDHPDGGVHYETVRVACGILAGNRWDGVLTHSATFDTTDDAKPAFFVGKDAYFHLPDWQPSDPNDPEPELKRRYPIIVRWDEWVFPHENLPQIWKDVLPHPERVQTPNEAMLEQIRTGLRSNLEAKAQEEAQMDSALEALGSICDPQGGDHASALEAQRTHQADETVVHESSETSSQSINFGDLLSSATGASESASGQPLDQAASTLMTLSSLFKSLKDDEAAASEAIPAETTLRDQKTLQADSLPDPAADPRSASDPTQVIATGLTDVRKGSDSDRNTSIVQRGRPGLDSDNARLNDENSADALLEALVANLKDHPNDQEESFRCQLCNADDADSYRLLDYETRSTDWYDKNHMWQYADIDPTAVDQYADVAKAQRSARGAVRLEDNCHGERANANIVQFSWEEGQWVFAPKFEWCGKPRIVGHVLAPQYDWGEYWEKGMESTRDSPLLRPDLVSLELLFAQFAYGIFANLNPFLHAEVDRYLTIEDHKGVVEPRMVPAEICSKLYGQCRVVMPKKLFNESLRLVGDLDVSKRGEYESGIVYGCDGCSLVSILLYLPRAQRTH